MKKSKILVALLVISLMIVSVFAGCGKKETAPANTCSITVTAADILEHKDELSEEKQALIPDDGIIFKDEKVGFDDGAKLFDVLTKALEKEKIQYDAQGGTYLVGIGNLYASDYTYGGWMFTVNGEMPAVGADEIELKNGDVVEFFYVYDYNAYFSEAAA